MLVIMKNEAYFVRRLITLFVIPFIETDIAQEITVRRCSLMQVIDVDYRFEKKHFLVFPRRGLPIRLDLGNKWSVRSHKIQHQAK